MNMTLGIESHLSPDAVGVIDVTIIDLADSGVELNIRVPIKFGTMDVIAAIGEELPKIILAAFDSMIDGAGQ